MADEALYYNLHARYTTFIAGAGIAAFSRDAKHGSSDVGKAVMKSGEGEVDLVTTGSRVFGKLVKVEPDGFCTVQDEGYCDLPTDGTAITYGATNDGLIGGATAGTVKSSGAAAGLNAMAIKGDGAGRVIAKLNS